MSGSDDADQAVPDERIRPTAALPTGGGPLLTDEPDPSGSGHPAKSASGSPSASASPSSKKSGDPTKGSQESGTTAAGGAGPVLSSGQSGAEVLELQLRLKQATVYSPKADGYYDTDVQSAVARYQRLHGITGDPDGVYGPNTRSVLESRTSEP
jgi:peptidoglycan hydrolase-like protein with peptidoglycan-binding domain